MITVIIIIFKNGVNYSLLIQIYETNALYTINFCDIQMIRLLQISVGLLHILLLILISIIIKTCSVKTSRSV